MNKTLADQYLRYALAYLQNSQAAETLKDNQASSFGAGVISMGLLPTIAVYQKDAQKRAVNDAILAILKNDSYLHIPESCMDLLSYAVNDHHVTSHQRRERVLMASVALKIAMRTFG